MGALSKTQWGKIPISLQELSLETTLRCGQSFRWRRSPTNVWSLALHSQILQLHQDSTNLHYRAHNTTSSASTLALLTHYLNLTPNLTNLYKAWSAADPNFSRKAPRFAGVRILKQDAWEALVGFICSSNNNIARISQMVEKLCLHYGKLIGHVDGEAYHDFPPPEKLARPGVEQHLRELGFGYRAKYLYQTAVIVSREREEGWLEGLRNNLVKEEDQQEMPEGGREGYRQAHEALLELQGVGPKVADCVCLMGLGWGEAVPVDTHVWQIAQRDYRFGKGKHSSLTKATYDAVGNRFRSLWGKEAGWAHSVLFTADLRAFSERLVAKIELTEKIEKKPVKIEGEGHGETVQKRIKSEDGNEEDEKENVIQEVKQETIVEKRIKPEWDDTEHKVLEVHEDMMSRVKRRRLR